MPKDLDIPPIGPLCEKRHPCLPGGYFSRAAPELSRAMEGGGVGGTGAPGGNDGARIGVPDENKKTTR